MEALGNHDHLCSGGKWHFWKTKDCCLNIHVCPIVRRETRLRKIDNAKCPIFRLQGLGKFGSSVHAQVPHTKLDLVSHLVSVRKLGEYQSVGVSQEELY